MSDTDRPTPARIVEAAFVLKNAGYPDVAKFLLAKDKRAAHGTGKRKVTLRDERGHKIELYAADVKRMSEPED